MWNIVAYLAFIGIIIGVFWEKYRNLLVTVGAFVLMLYAGIFLHNPLFATLQLVIVISGVLSLLKSSKLFSICLLTLSTAVSYLYLVLNGAITNIWAFIGSLGLLCIAFGLVILPKPLGFLVMAAGGVFLTIYAFTVSAWVFVFLNLFFTIANIITWQKSK